MDGVAAQDVLRKGFQDLKAICEITKEKFQKACQDFDKQN